MNAVQEAPDEKWNLIGIDTMTSEDGRYVVEEFTWVSPDSLSPMTEYWLNDERITVAEYASLCCRGAVYMNRAYLSLNRKAANAILNAREKAMEDVR